MSTYDELIARLRSNVSDEAAAAARALAELGDSRAVDPLVQVMKQTNVPAVRDAAAVALRDLGDPRALRPLLELIADPKTESHRGTLVYALGGFDCARIVPQLVQLVIAGNFEVSRQAFSVIESIEGEIAAQDWKTSMDTLKAALPSADDQKRLLLEQLLELFEQSD
jgi:hypothetical protein